LGQIWQQTQIAVNFENTALSQ